MASIHCIKHLDYDGKRPPNLSCKICCSIYIREIKEQQESHTSFNAYKWIADKTSKKADKPKHKTLV